MAPTESRAKKRTANSQGGPDTKKRHTEASKPKTKTVPVTSTIQDEESSDQASSSSDVEMQDAHQIQDVVLAQAGTGASYESHQTQKQILAQRKASKPNAAMMEQAKRIWASARKRDLPRAEREKLCKQLADLINGKVVEVVFKHDASRIIQTLVKYGRREEREMVALELKGRYQELAQNKYSKFLVLKLIRHCPSQRPFMLSEFHGHVLRLLLHREAGQVISESFELYANASDRSKLLREFYGKEVSLFESEKEKANLRDILQGMEEERKKRILAALKENIQKIFENSEKGAVSNAIVHSALWEYLSEVDRLEDQTEAEKLRREMFELCQDSLAEMIHTRHGSLSVRYFTAHGTAKDRKQIVKQLKPHLERIALDGEAQLVLFTLLDVTDDTKMIQKSILSDLTALTKKLYSDANGRRALLYPIVGRNSRHFTPAIIATLAITDSIREKTSKKDENVRREEILKALSEDMLRQVRENVKEMIIDPGGSLLVIEVLLHAEGDKAAASEAVIRQLQVPYPGSETIRHPIEHPHTSRVYKTLLQGGHWSQMTSSIERSSRFNPTEFASMFLRIVGDDDGERIVGMAGGGGTFVVAELCERINKEGTGEQKERLRGWFTNNVVKGLEKASMKGCGVLLEKLKALHDEATPQPAQTKGKKRKGNK